MPMPVIGSTTEVHFVERPPWPPLPPPLLMKGAGAVGLMLTTVLLMSPRPSPPPLATAGEAEAARLSAAMPATIEVRVMFIGFPLGRGASRGEASARGRLEFHWTLVLGPRSATGSAQAASAPRTRRS